MIVSLSLSQNDLIILLSNSGSLNETIDDVLLALGILDKEELLIL